MKAAKIPSGKYCVEGSRKKDKQRISYSKRKAEEKEKRRRKKIRQAKLAARLVEEEGEPGYSRGMYNELDPLLAYGSSSSDSDDVPLAQMLAK